MLNLRRNLVQVYYKIVTEHQFGLHELQKTSLLVSPIESMNQWQQDMRLHLDKLQHTTKRYYISKSELIIKLTINAIVAPKL